MPFNFIRFVAIVRKEFIQMRRDRLTFAMMFGIPIIQLILFGFAINTDPKNLPVAVLASDNSPFARRFVHAMENSGYFRIVDNVETEEAARRLLARGEVQFVLNLPPDFSRRLVRGDKPAMLVQADATDPSAVSSAVQVIQEIARSAFDRDLAGPLQNLAAKPGPVELRIHLEYNPDRLTQYNIVPGLMGVVLTMTMVMITALAVTRERERGTMESLLATPALPLEVMTGKIIPYILVGYVQVTLILLAAKVLFRVPMVGSFALLYLCGAVLYRRHTRRRHHHLDSGYEPTASPADVVFLLSALAVALRIHVPVPRHAGVGPGDRPGAAFDPFSPRVAGHSAERERIPRRLARDLADPGLRLAGDGCRRRALPENARLEHLAQLISEKRTEKPRFRVSRGTRDASPPPTFRKLPMSKSGGMPLQRGKKLARRSTRFQVSKSHSKLSRCSGLLVDLMRPHRGKSG